MIKAYIVLAHSRPLQLFRLVKALDDGLSTFFIHIDSETSFDKFENLTAFGDKIHFVERVSSKWSTYGLVQCTLNALKSIKKTKIGFGRIILLSGQCYPIKSNRQINEFLHESLYSVFIEYWELPDFDKWPASKGGMYRVNKYFFGLGKYQLLFSRAINFLGNVFPFFKRKMILGMKPFAGSQWWILDMYAVDYILDFINKHPEYVTFHRHTFASDEVFFHMILLNSPDERIRKSIQNDNKRFMKWKSPIISHPDILKKNDFTDIVQSNNLFARKFDDQSDVEILDLIDYIR